jgi:hypothetical protein
VRKSSRRTAIVLVTSLLVGLASALTSAAPVAATPQPFELDMVEGELFIRDAEEPSALEQPTSISGQHDTGDGGTGAVTAGTFTSPPISFETEAVGQPVFVDAAFSQVTPASGTGSIDAEGNVSFQTTLTVDLHIEVNNPPALVQECSATPVSIGLNSTAPYDPETGEVTVRDADFTVPPVPVTESCISLVAENVNTLLAGSGHSLTMTLAGELELPPPEGCPTTTTLEVTPATTSFLGDDVTLEATVAPDPDESPECAEAVGVVPSGSVEFSANGAPIDVAPLDGTGTAVLVTDDIPAGEQQLVARYRPTPPYTSSSSAPAAHRVAVRPLAVVDAPTSIPIGGAPQEITVEVTNTALGSDVINGRLDLTASYVNTGSLTSLVVEWWDGSTWVPAPMLDFGAFAVASVMPDVGVPLPQGETVTQQVRITAPSTLNPGRINLAFELVLVDPATGSPDPTFAPAPAALASGSVESALVNADRLTSVPIISATPHTLRQGMSGAVQVTLDQVGFAPPPSGTFQLLLDGQVVPVRPRQTNPAAVGYQPRISVPGPNSSMVYVLPSDTRTGTQDVTLRYSGDAFYRPTLASTTITVLPAVGTSFACLQQSAAFTEGFDVNVTATALMPAAAQVGRPLRLDQLDIEISADRGVAYQGFFAFPPPEFPVIEPGMGLDGFEVVDFGFGELGTGRATTSVKVANQVFMDDSTRPVDPDPDVLMTFVGETAELAVSGTPGQVVPVELETIDLTLAFAGGAFLIDVACTVGDEPLSLGDVVIAGTTLTVDAPDPAREGDAVTLTANVAPVGTDGSVEFLDGSTTLTVVPVASDGTASFTTDDLGVGTHDLTAVFRSGSAVTSSTSAVVPLVVIDRHDCPTLTELGDGATVRLAYLLLAGRCPSAAEHDYWVTRLDDGTSPAVLARSLARSIEGYGQLVDRAYEQVLGRAPDAAGRTFWATALRDGYRIDRLMASMAASPEFYAHAGGTDAGFVDLLYERILDRAAEPAGAAFWTGQLASGVPRWQVARAFTGVAETRRQLTVVAYEVVLGRAPSASEATAGVALLAGGDLALLYERLAGGAEFVDRAQDLPNP